MSEGSIGANLRRIEAVTGEGALARIHDEEVQLRELAELAARSAPAELPDRVERLLGAGEGSCRTSSRAERREAGGRRGGDARGRRRPTASSSCGATASSRDDLRPLALATRDALGSGVVALVGLAPDGAQGRARGRGEQGPASSAGVSAADDRARRGARRSAAAPAKNADVVQGGGPNVGAVDDALAPRCGRGACAPPRAERRRRGRVLGVDLGARRIGLAALRPVGHARQPATRRSSAAATPTDDHRAILAAAARGRRRRASWSGCRARSSGELGPAAPVGARRGRGAGRGRARRATSRSSTYDERFTTVIAAAQPARDATGDASGARAARQVDAAAATVILQSWLDARPRERRATDEPSGPTTAVRRSSRRRRRAVDAAPTTTPATPNRRRVRRRRADRRRRAGAASARRAPSAPAPWAVARRARGAGPAVRARGGLVRAASWTRRAATGDAGHASTIQPGWGTKEVGDALASKRRDRLVARVPALGRRSSGGAVPGRHLRAARAHGRPTAAADALERGPPTRPRADTHARAPARAHARRRSPTASAQLPGHDRDAFLALAQSGAVRSKYQPADQTSLEGFTWPDTYFVGEHQTDERRSCSTIVDGVRRARRRGRTSATPRATGLTPHQTVVVASLIQAEAGSAADAPQGLGGDRQPPRSRACRCRSTPPSATPRAAARRCRPTPTSRSTRRTTPTGSPACRRRRS